MSLNWLQNKVFNQLKADPALNALGITEPTLYPAYSPDSPQEQRFAVLRWGPIEPGLGGARHIELYLWAYERDEDYQYINQILTRFREIFNAWPGTGTAGQGWVLGVIELGSSPNLRDDVYESYTRNEGVRITASGL